MNEVGGSESGTGLRAIKSSRSSDANFEYDDSEWDVGIGNLIIDLDADIEKNNEANRNNNNSDSSNSLSNPQMHIPLTSSSSSSGSNTSGNTGTNSSSGSGNKTSSTQAAGSGTNSSNAMEHSSVVDKGLKMKIKRTKTGTKSADAKHEIVKNDVVGSSNGTAGTGNSGYASNKSISDAISTKNSHPSHKDKDKLLIKDGLLLDNSHDGSTNSKQQDNSAAEPGGKVKTPRKVSTKEKKVKNNNTPGNSKKDDKSNDSSNSNKNLSNSGNSSSGSSGSSGTHAKDNKEFFSTTVNLNVPNVIPNSSSSAFVKTTATIKVPTAPSSSASSILSASSGSGLHAHSSDSTTSSTTNSNSTSVTKNISSNTPWGTVSPSKGAAEKGRLSPSVSNLSSASEKIAAGNSYNKKSRTSFVASDKVIYIYYIVILHDIL